MEAKKDVELDTDDVQEQAIAVEEAPKEDVKPEIGDVDLGYSDPIKEKTEAKIVKETTQPETNNNEDNLEDYSEGVKKRIDKLTRRMREAERGQKAALDYAKGLQSKYTEANKQAHKYDKDFVKEFEARVDSERNTVKQNLKQAIERLVHHVDKLNGIVMGLVTSQMQFNAAVTAHTHISPFGGAPTTPSPTVISAGMQVMVSQMKDTTRSLLTHKANLQIYKAKYLTPVADCWILSRHNKAN